MSLILFTQLPPVYGLGDKNEALYYAAFALNIWKKTKGAINWLKKNNLHF